MLLAMFLIAFSVNSFGNILVQYLGLTVATLFSSYLILSVKKHGFAAMVCVILGCSTILLALFSANDVSSVKPFLRFQIYAAGDYASQVQIYKQYLHTYSAIIGVACISLGLIFAYRPSLVQVKNYLPFEYPYPIWESNKREITKFSKNLIPIRELLTDEEKLRCCRFSFILVSIEGKPHLVNPNDKIPEDSQIMRTKSGNTLCGISRSR